MKFVDDTPYASTQRARNDYYKSIREKVWGCTSDEDFEALSEDIEALRLSDEQMPHSMKFSYYEQILDDIEEQKLTIEKLKTMKKEFDHEI